MKKIFWVYGWALVVVGATILIAFTTYQIKAAGNWQFASRWLQPEVTNPEPTPPTTDALFNTTQGGQVKGISTIIETRDARAELVAEFLARHDSPLVPHEYFGQVFVDLADKNGFDFRLLPAIAMQESNLCKRIPPGSYNCLGFGIHERGTLTFPSYESNFERAARELKANYIDIGLTTPEQIMRKYTPSSEGSWANSVNQWMAEMKYNDRQQGRDLKTNASVFEYAVASDSAQQ